MKKLYINRMRRLIKFLRNLPAENFNFAYVSAGGIKKGVKLGNRECGAVGCAIGWTPRVFPNIVEYAPRSENKFIFVNGVGGPENYRRVAEKLFGIDFSTAHALFTPNCQSLLEGLTDLSIHATSNEVADMLEEFLKTQTTSPE
jgi:hypothetical protein